MSLAGHALVGVGVLASVISGTQDWWRVRLGDTVVKLSESTGATAGMLVLVVAIGWLLWATQTKIGRRVVGVVIAVVALLMTGYGVRPPRPGAADMDAVSTRTGSAAEPVLELGWWHWAYAAAGGLILVGALLLAVGAPDRRRKVDRYRRGHQDAAAVNADDDAAELWRAMDAGYDPTAAPQAGEVPEDGAPNDQNPPSGGNLAEDRRE